MHWQDYWGALGARQRMGLLVGTIALVAALAVALLWLFRDPWIPLADQLDADRLAEVAQQLDRSSILYRVGVDGRSIEVAESSVGKARVATAANVTGIPSDIGLEMFKESDFSTTDFAQRINYQRALQGEIARTVHGISGVKAVRVHVILPEAGLFKREGARSSAAVTVTMRPGRVLAPAQVRGIQRLVVASVPQIRASDVVVLDDAGASLTRPGDSDAESATSALDVKRQVDQYLEAKLQRLLQDLVPNGVVSLSVDADIDPRQLRVTTEEPLSASAPQPGEHPTGVLSRERQSQRGQQASGAPSSPPTDAPRPESADWENEYKVGRRVEQALAAPGSIRRLSVAVVLQGAPRGVDASQIERLVGHAVGVAKSRGDSVDVLMMAADETTVVEKRTAPPVATVMDAAAASAPRLQSVAVVNTLGVLVVAVLLALGGALAWRQHAPRTPRGRAQRHRDLNEVTARVRQWLAEGSGHVHD